MSCHLRIWWFLVTRDKYLKEIFLFVFVVVNISDGFNKEESVN